MDWLELVDFGFLDFLIGLIYPNGLKLESMEKNPIEGLIHDFG